MRPRSRVLVTGGAGFVGANLVRRLAGRCDIRLLDNLTSAGKDNVPPEAELVIADVRDAAAVRAALAGATAVVHLAAEGSVVESVADPRTSFEINVTGTLNVLDAARAEGVDRVVFASTGGALFGESTGPVDESSVPRPVSPYGASKAAAEAYLQAYAGSYGLHTVALRFSNLYGRFSAHKKGVVGAFFQALHAGEPLVIYGDGLATRDFIDVRDICAGIELALDADIPSGCTMHLATGVETSVAELADLCRAVAGRPDHPVEHRAARAGEVRHNVGNAALAERLLGFTPTVPLRTGLADTWAWYREHVFR